MKFKRGESRDDGMIFWQYHPTAKNGEIWISVDEYKKKKERKSITDRKRYERDIDLNREKSKIASRKRYKENKKSCYEASRRWANKNKEKIKFLGREWNKKNKEYVALQTAKRRARILNQMPEDHNDQIELVLRSSAKRISMELGIPFHIDHIIPLASGGLHHHTNLQILPASINMRKGAKVNYDGTV